MRHYLWQVRPYNEFHLFCLFFAYCFTYCLPRQISGKTWKSDLASKSWLCKYSDPSGKVQLAWCRLKMLELLGQVFQGAPSNIKSSRRASFFLLDDCCYDFFPCSIFVTICSITFFHFLFELSFVSFA